jgi:hypothetical protein
MPTGLTARETPVAIRVTHVLLVMAWNCVARHHDVALEFHTLKPPPRRAPKSARDDAHRLKCIASAWVHAAEELLGGADAREMLKARAIELGVYDDPEGEASNATAAAAAGAGAAAAGAEIADEVMTYVRDDGWNANGRENGRAHNLRPYADFTGYVPAPHKEDGLPSETNPRRWVPLPETNGLGYFRRVHIYTGPQTTASAW